MQDKKELLERLSKLCTEAEIDDTDNTDLVMSVLKTAVKELAENSPKTAGEIIDAFDGMLHYYNYLSDAEAEEILKRFENEDGTTGAKWKDADAFFSKCEQMGVKYEQRPEFNRFSFWVECNRMASDFNSVITKLTDSNTDKYFQTCCDMATCQLTDRDNQYYTRTYYQV